MIFKVLAINIAISFRLTLNNNAEQTLMLSYFKIIQMHLFVLNFKEIKLFVVSQQGGKQKLKKL